MYGVQSRGCDQGRNVYREGKKEGSLVTKEVREMKRKENNTVN